MFLVVFSVVKVRHVDDCGGARHIDRDCAFLFEEYLALAMETVNERDLRI